MAWQLLTLDLATCTGWCEGTGEELPQVGHLKLPPAVGGVRGPAFHMLRRWLVGTVERMRTHGDVAVLFEQPILPKAFVKNGRIIYPTNIETTLMLQGLVAIVEEACFELGVECHYIDVSSAKRELAGRGSAKKIDMVYVAQKVGLKIAVHDEADAFAVFLVGLRHYNPKASREFDRLIWSSRGALL